MLKKKREIEKIVLHLLTTIEDIDLYAPDKFDSFSG